MCCAQNPSCLGRVCGAARAARLTVGGRQRRSCRADATAALVRRALLRAEPELPRSRLRGGLRAMVDGWRKTEAKLPGRRDCGARYTCWIY
ncbi:hypothetical protein NDU88_003432 [Pleurodeles waltl]|uniref:Uncharacterized protein n=1 Tax=Pleurodeles waltl TaxID=8319 RepID=A0AAV7LII8_PLEWA|nr:hypothetical protein NDU88_003432 [Pleurodeles waltl]